MKSIKEIIKHIQTHARKHTIEAHNTLNAWLDYMIEYFDISQYRTPDGWAKMQDAKFKESPELYSATYLWMSLTADNMEKGQSSDVLGYVYEELFQSKSKASSLGQFFTPMCLSDLCSMLTSDGKKNNRVTVNDCACGSGRMLVSHYMQATSKNQTNNNSYYVGEDIDITSVKMCALNLMIHGMHGRAIRHDTLRDPISFDYGFEVNEVRYPFPTPFYSLRRITYKETEEQRKARLSEIEKPAPRITPKKTAKPKEQTETTVLPLSKPDKDGQYSLF